MKMSCQYFVLRRETITLVMMLCWWVSLASCFLIGKQSASGFHTRSRLPLQHQLSSSTSKAATGTIDPLEILQSATVVNPKDNSQCRTLDGLALRVGGINNNVNNPLSSFLESSSLFNNNNNKDKKYLVIVMPQLGEFDSAEYAELLAAVKDDLHDQANMELRIIGIGNSRSAKRFAKFTGLPLDCIRVDPQGQLHRHLQLHGGPNWDIPSFVPDSILEWFADYVGISNKEEEDLELVTRAWVNYMAMCAGIAAPDTLPEILRGYFGDKSAPERLRADETVRVGDNLIAVKGVTDVKLGPIEYQSLWKNEVGYQRPAELATVRLRIMVEVLSNFAEYCPDQKHLHLRGATYLFDNEGRLEYEHRDTGVLAYSATMPRPLTFLQPYIGEKALNPLELGDNNRAVAANV